MNELNISLLEENDAQFNKLVDALEECFRSDWDDAIHDTYKRYVHQEREMADRVRAIRTRADSLVREVERLKIDDLYQKADALSKEAESI